MQNQDRWRLTVSGGSPQFTRRRQRHTRWRRPRDKPRGDIADSRSEASVWPTGDTLRRNRSRRAQRCYPSLTLAGTNSVGCGPALERYAHLLAHTQQGGAHAAVTVFPSETQADGAKSPGVAVVAADPPRRERGISRESWRQPRTHAFIKSLREPRTGHRARRQPCQWQRQRPLVGG